jgi:hypothetical protein
VVNVWNDDKTLFIMATIPGLKKEIMPVTIKAEYWSANELPCNSRMDEAIRLALLLLLN